MLSLDREQALNFGRFCVTFHWLGSLARCVGNLDFVQIITTLSARIGDPPVKIVPRPRQETLMNLRLLRLALIAVTVAAGTGPGLAATITQWSFTSVVAAPFNSPTPSTGT